MKQSVVAVLMPVPLRTPCSGEPFEPEAAAMQTCTTRFDPRAGAQQGSDDNNDTPWRITSRTEAERFVASFWTETPTLEAVIAYVSEARLGPSADAPSEVIEVRP